MSFFVQLKYAFNPAAHKLMRKRTYSTFTFACKLLLLSMIIACLFFLPSATEWPSQVSWQLSQFNVELSGNITTSTPVLFPLTNPVILVDTSGNRKTIGTENVLITNSFLEYRIIRQPYRIDFNQDVKKQAGGFAAIAAIFILPAFLFWMYAIILMKYILLALFVSLISWLFLDLFHLKQPLKQVLSSAFLSLSIVIPLEILSLPFDTKWLMPTSEIFLVKIYLTTTIIYIIMFALSILFSAKEETTNP